MRRRFFKEGLLMAVWESLVFLFYKSIKICIKDCLSNQNRLINVWFCQFLKTIEVLFWRMNGDDQDVLDVWKRSCVLQIEKVYACEQHVFYLAVFQRIIDDFSVSSLFDDVRRFEKSQLVRTGRLIERQNSCKVAHAHFAYTKRTYDFCSRCVRACREKFCKRVQSRIARNKI